MDKDRLAGSAKQAKGSMKEMAGKILGDGKMRAEGAVEKEAGKAQNAAGSVKDAVRDAAKKN